jgi:hypothetical protein
MILHHQPLAAVQVLVSLKTWILIPPTTGNLQKL